MSPPPPIPLAEAQERLLGMAAPLGSETVPAAAAAGRYLAAPLEARRTQPPADLSAMDGYAMRGDDIAGPWRVIGESAAGLPFPGEVRAGEAVRISTGALMPTRAGAILLQENARREGDVLHLVEGKPTPGHIRRAGFDFREGDVLLEAGTRLGPAQIALGLAGGYGEVAVGRLPAVAILDSGDELAADPAACAPHQIPASNGVMLAAMAAPYARSVTRIGPVGDEMSALMQALEQAQEADVLVTSGGASVGDHDLVRPALEQWGAWIDYWRVAIKPGKPLLIARRDRQLILGLPGNPVSSYVTAYLFLLPLLRALGGANFRFILPQAVQAFVDAPLPPTGDRQELIRAHYANNNVTPLDQQDSSALNALARSNALIDRKPNSPAVSPPYAVLIYLLDDVGVA